eukprot:CAMPEP_0198320134 /NCGR_PEP_ID=MMETSP1450-20131203/9121_1 /TAXON_ID=753684 ORGANISM="Madagascaria erythrocladiodes, Strain CCMP3234" /NCGR_SAMPLE_ID=MMETSP1450 /ASSEMBLY_ACC=CAM_ASM_001115 /LENGTH=422 /DNA_ID=CAMNT_0044023577 /DNA_START=96 /DNA_END=1361 /DNA_ORIENTATION=-
MTSAREFDGPPVSVQQLRTAGVVYEGWLTKQGAKRKNWKKRWFVLVDQPEPTMYYFEKADAKRDIGRFALDKKTTSVRPTFCEDKKNYSCFEIVTADRTWLLFGDKAEDTETWINTINQTIGTKLRSLTQAPKVGGEALLNRQGLGTTNDPLGTASTAEQVQTQAAATREYLATMEQFVVLANEYQQRLTAVRQTGRKLASLMYKLGSVGCFDYPEGEELCKIATANRDIENKREDLSKVIAEKLVTPYQGSAIPVAKKKLEEEVKEITKKQDAAEKDVKKAKQVKKKVEAKSVSKSAADVQLGQAMQDLETKLSFQKKLNDDSLKQLVATHREHLQGLMTNWTDVLEVQAVLVDMEYRLTSSLDRWKTNSAKGSRAPSMSATLPRSSKKPQFDTEAWMNLDSERASATADDGAAAAAAAAA